MWEGITFSQPHFVLLMLELTPQFPHSEAIHSVQISDMFYIHGRYIWARLFASSIVDKFQSDGVPLLTALPSLGGM